MPRPRKKESVKYCQHCDIKLNRKIFNGRLEDLSVYEKRKYCSRSCANSKKNPKCKSTYSMRARKFLKDTCESCDWNLSLQVHHVDQDYTNNVEQNIQTLCKHCHDFWHTTAKRLGKEIAGKMPIIIMDGKEILTD